MTPVEQLTIPKALKLTPAEVADLKNALDIVTVYDIWRLIGLSGYRHLPHDRRNHNCLSPFRDENKASFSVFCNGRRWKDHAEPDPDLNNGDQVDFLVRATGLSPEVASRIIIAITRDENHDDQPSDEETYDPFTDPNKAVKRATWPVLEIPSPEEIDKISKLRSLSHDGLEAAVTRCYLRCATWQNVRVWVITDETLYAAQARRMDGQIWGGYLKGAKAASLPGSIGTWPIGIKEAAAFPAIALVEGGPDMLAAIDLIMVAGAEAVIAPVVMLGATMGIAEESLPLFSGKHVKIFIHVDDAGQKAAGQWAEQLEAAGADVMGYSFDGLTLGDTAVSDLNDLVKLFPEDPVQAGELISDAFNFTN